ncbi:hypothetical protein [Streptomyces reniochalinae]|uniref:Uncharacterized protein n=1 Tax=Streptomyces reniochalinae TaxID=2250578 RepID=A0A367F1A4_9ACTN|nr:hypothetical protein [Streptomyces reniochalinae]RCG24154.1 hypothetical protein DQ392_03145 [Streptomyces reniochalinae]
MVPLALRAAASWPARRWGVAAAAAALTALAVGVPTAVIPTPLFGRAVATPWWAWPTLALTALLAGLLLATYVRAADPADDDDRPTTASTSANTTAGSSAVEDPDRRSSTRLGTVGGALSFFAVGCPVCNKLVLLALGTSGALTVWQPLQPVLALASLTLLAVATVRRLAGETACPVAPAA